MLLGDRWPAFECKRWADVVGPPEEERGRRSRRSRLKEWREKGESIKNRTRAEETLCSDSEWGRSVNESMSV